MSSLGVGRAKQKGRLRRPLLEDPNGLDATYSDTTLNYTVCSAMKCFTITLSFPLRLIISTAAFAISDTE